LQSNEGGYGERIRMSKNLKKSWKVIQLGWEKLSWLLGGWELWNRAEKREIKCTINPKRPDRGVKGMGMTVPLTRGGKSKGVQGLITIGVSPEKGKREKKNYASRKTW